MQPGISIILKETPLIVHSFPSYCGFGFGLGLGLGLGLSSITYMELMVGALNKREVGVIKKAFSDFEVVEISESISVKARSLIEKYTKSHGLLIPDALIGATALELGSPLYTTNIKDFQFIPDL